MSAKGKHPMSPSPQAVVRDWIFCPSRTLLWSIQSILYQNKFPFLFFAICSFTIRFLSFFSFSLLAFSFSISPSFVVKNRDRDFPGDPPVRNAPYTAGDSGLIPARQQGSHCLWASKPIHHNQWAHVPQLRPERPKEINVFLKTETVL